ncbi:site-2 protease family protein [Candidatus Gracilibacteria bacterium]|nr:site-2 protease family protein [Candidatus Gracilibacteria bacterium]
MNIILGIILAIIVFSVIVFFHELGHFLFAKLFGVKVEEFGIGIPPRITRLFKDKSGTEYTINWFPIGGFVKLFGEEYNEDTIKNKNSLVSKSTIKQMIIILAGVCFNFIIATVIFTTAFMIGTGPLTINTKFDTNVTTKLIPSLNEAVNLGIIKTSGIILSPIVGSIADNAGLKEGDILLSIDNEMISSPEQMVEIVSSSKKSLKFLIRRGNDEFIKGILPISGKIGAYVGYNVSSVNKDFKYKFSPSEAVRQGFGETINQSKLVLELMKNLVSKILNPKNNIERTEAVNSLGGPIAVGNLFVDLVKENASILMILLIGALLSVNLAIFNLLPLPALDGGRFFIMLLNSIVIFIFGKKVIDGRVENLIHLLGFLFLITLSLFVAYKDIFKLIFN